MSDQMEFKALDVPDHERFTMVYDDVWNVLKGTSQLSVYMAIKRRTNPGNHSWFGTRKDLAEESGLSLGTFQRGIKYLEKIGLIKVVPRFVPAKWDKDPKKIVHKRDTEHPYQIANLYLIRFHLPKENELDTPIKNDPPVKTPTKNDPPLRGKNDPPLGIKIGTQTYIPNNINTRDIETSKDMLIPGGKSVTPSNSTEVSEPGKDTTQASEKKTPAEKYPKEFLEWYNIYPRKKAKGDALKAYRQALKEIDHDELVEKTRKYARYVEQTQEPAKYVPYPATWLRASQWDDELEPPEALNQPGTGPGGSGTPSARDKSAEQLLREQWAREDAYLNSNTNQQPQAAIFEWPYGAQKEIEQ